MSFSSNNKNVKNSTISALVLISSTFRNAQEALHQLL